VLWVLAVTEQYYKALAVTEQYSQASTLHSAVHRYIKQPATHWIVSHAMLGDVFS